MLPYHSYTFHMPSPPNKSTEKIYVFIEREVVINLSGHKKNA